MHTRRLAGFLLGAWMLGCVFMGYAAFSNFATVDHLLERPAAPAGKMIQSLGGEQARLLLRHQAAEENRALFRMWGRAEVALGLGTLVTLAFATRRRIYPLVLCLAMLIIAGMQAVALTPELTYLGRTTDFPPLVDAQQTRFAIIHQLYGGIELLKLLLGLMLAVYLFWFRARRRSRKEVNAVDNADDRHVDW